MMEKVGFSFWLMVAGLVSFCLSVIGWAGLGIAGYGFASERVLQAGLMLLAALLVSGLVVYCFYERIKRRG